MVGKGSYGVVCSAIDNFTGEAVRGEVVGKGSYGVVCSAIDNFTGEAMHGGGRYRAWGGGGLHAWGGV